MIKKAIIPAAGLGTRVLPASKALPKEMLPIVDKPAIQYIVEEAVAAGIEDILIITNRGKGIIEDHFDHSYELEHKLTSGGRESIAEDMARIAHLANIYYIRQKETKGLGHAVLTAKSFIGDEPFAVLYGDDVICSDRPVIGQLAQVYEEFQLGVVGVKEVPLELVQKYSSLKVEKVRDRLFQCDDMIEKPAPGREFSQYSILGRCILPPEIFSILEATPPGVGGEIQLTDAMKRLAVTKGMMALDFDGTRYDMGNKLGILIATVEIALRHPEIGADFAKYLKDLQL